MLINEGAFKWWYMEIPRTGTTSVTKGLRDCFGQSRAPYAKHWPLLPPTNFRAVAKSVVSIRNPLSRAVSCWKFFNDERNLSFSAWTRLCLSEGFFDSNIWSKPQTFWFDITGRKWDYILRQENLEADLKNFFTDYVNGNSSRIHAPFMNACGDDIVNRVGVRTTKNDLWKSYYCEESLLNVKKIYESDFTAFSELYTAEEFSQLDKQVSVNL